MKYVINQKNKGEGWGGWGDGNFQSWAIYVIYVMVSRTLIRVRFGLVSIRAKDRARKYGLWGPYCRKQKFVVGHVNKGINLQELHGFFFFFFNLGGMAPLALPWLLP